MKIDQPHEIVQGCLDRGLFTAASYAIIRSGIYASSSVFGCTDNSADAHVVDDETLFDVASLTKPVVTATLILQLMEQFSLQPHTRVRDLIAVKHAIDGRLGDVTIHQLLTHTSGLPPIPAPLTDVSAAVNVVESILQTSLAAEPGTSYSYSDCGFILLGAIVEAISAPLDIQARDSIFRPLNMSDSRFFRLGTDGNVVLPARPAVSTTIGVQSGIVHDPRARAMGGLAGHAGLFSTTRDLCLFGEAIRTGGSGVVDAESLAKMQTSQIPLEIGSHSYGWFCQGAPLFPASDFFSPTAYAHSGFTGCVLAIDPAREMTLVLLTNRVYASPDDNRAYLEFRRRFLRSACER